MKKITLLSSIFLVVLVLAGCGTSNTEIIYSLNTVLKTADGGTTWETAAKDTTDKTIIVSEILALEVNPINSQVVYAGTEKDGLFISDDGGMSWKKLDFPLTRIYSLKIGRGGASIVYASGLLKERGKVYKSLNGGQDWQEIYSEPANGPLISSLAVDPKNQETVYAGNSEGMIIKTLDGGKTWKNLIKVDNPVTAIVFDSSNSSAVYFLAFNDKIIRTKNGGETFDDLSENLEATSSDGAPFFLLADPNHSGIFYAGLNSGLLRGIDFGNKFETLNIIESSKNFPIRALAVNPQNSNELIYSSAQALYKSVDGGKKWSTFQLDTTRTGSQLKYDPRSPDIIYLGLRKVE